MKIEFEFKPDNIEILDYIIRDMDWYDEEKNTKKPHLQARIKTKNRDLEGYHNCSISYYDSSGKFLGLDTGNFHIPKNSNKLPSSISTPLDIPEGCKRMLATISPESESNTLFEFCIGLCVLFGVVILGSWAYSLVAELLSG